MPSRRHYGDWDDGPLQIKYDESPQELIPTFRPTSTLSSDKDQGSPPSSRNARYKGYYKNFMEEPIYPITGSSRANSVPSSSRKRTRPSFFVPGAPAKSDPNTQSFNYGHDDITGQVKSNPYRQNLLHAENVTRHELDKLSREQAEIEQFMGQYHQHQKEIQCEDEQNQQRDLELVKSYEPYGKPGCGAPTLDSHHRSKALSNIDGWKNENNPVLYPLFRTGGGGAPIHSQSGVVKAHPEIRFQTSEPIKQSVDRTLRYMKAENEAKAYLGELDKMVESKKAMKLEEKQRDAVLDRQTLDYDPYGRPGAGAPQTLEKMDILSGMKRYSLPLSLSNNTEELKRVENRKKDEVTDNNKSHAKQNLLTNNIQELRRMQAKYLSPSNSRDSESETNSTVNSSRTNRHAKHNLLTNNMMELRRQEYRSRDPNTYLRLHTARLKQSYPKPLTLTNNPVELRRLSLDINSQIGYSPLHKACNGTMTRSDPVTQRSNFMGPIVKDSGDMETGHMISGGSGRRPSSDPDPPYHPYGKPGNGAPLVDKMGNLIADLNGKLYYDKYWLGTKRNPNPSYDKSQVLQNMKDDIIRHNDQKKAGDDDFQKPAAYDLATYVRSGHVGYPTRDPVTGDVHGTPRVLSDVTETQLDIRRPEVTAAKQYHDDLTLLADIRKKRRAIEKQQNSQDDALHTDTWSHIWGRPGHGAPLTDRAEPNRRQLLGKQLYQRWKFLDPDDRNQPLTPPTPTVARTIVVDTTHISEATQTGAPHRLVPPYWTADS